MSPFSSPASRRQALAVAAGVLFAACAALAVHGIPVVDEWAHYYQIQEFLRGHYTPIEGLTTIPGYHAVAAAALRLLHGDSLGLARAVTMGFAVLAVPAFAGIRRAVAPDEDPTLPTLQFLLFPLLFPFCFLVYTDLPSLALVLWSLRHALAGRHRTAGLLGFASLLVRQNNIVWIGFIALLQAQDIRARNPTWAARRRAFPVLLPYALNAVAFAGYWLWNGSISMSRVATDMHPDLTLHAGNLFFMLFLAGVFLAPLMAIWLPRYLRSTRNNAWLTLVPLLFGVLYASAFVVDHVANLFGMDYYLRNFILVFVSGHRAAWVGFGAIAVTAACALTQVRWQRRAYVLLLPVAVAFVSFLWLIEQRYYLIPFALLLALRTTEDRRAEWLMLALWAPVSVFFLYGMLTLRFFL
jgi:alpha-1,2-glucosyltransferase